MNGFWILSLALMHMEGSVCFGGVSHTRSLRLAVVGPWIWDFSLRCVLIEWWVHNWIQDLGFCGSLPSLGCTVLDFGFWILDVVVDALSWRRLLEFGSWILDFSGRLTPHPHGRLLDLGFWILDSSSLEYGSWI